jgi:hypothetical protein
MVAAPAVIGMATGAGVAGASLVVEGVVLGRVSALPGLLPVACALVALLLTLDDSGSLQHAHDQHGKPDCHTTAIAVAECDGRRQRNAHAPIHYHNRGNAVHHHPPRRPTPTRTATPRR